MKLKILIEDQYSIAAIMKGEKCPIEKSIEGFDRDFNALFNLLNRISTNGLSRLSSTISRQVNKKPTIFELRHGRLRFFYFHGKGNMIVICTESIVKKTDKVDKSVIDRAIKASNDYHSSIKNNTVTEIREL